MKILATILLLGILAFPVSRPYRHWAIYSRTCGNDWCEYHTKVLYEVDTYKEAVSKFTADHPDREVLCIARDYYFRCLGW